MKSTNQLAKQTSDVDRAHVVQRAVGDFLAAYLGVEPKKMTTVFSDNMLLVRAFRPFPEAEALVLSNHENDALYHQYYERLFQSSREILEQNLAGSLNCGIQQIHHVLNADAQELDIIITLNHSPAKITEEYTQ
jgi:uncharacterized protein YbcI